MYKETINDIIESDNKETQKKTEKKQSLPV